jgi:hypothetical protein
MGIVAVFVGLGLLYTATVKAQDEELVPLRIAVLRAG